MNNTDIQINNVMFKVTELNRRIDTAFIADQSLIAERDSLLDTLSILMDARTLNTLFDDNSDIGY